MKTDDEVDAGGAEPVDVADVDLLAIEEDGEQVRVDGSGVDELELAALREREEPRRPS